MREISFEEAIQLRRELLAVFHKYCMEHELNYSLAYGSLLGAVRHHGMIPWDDDIDVMMPRTDYQRMFMLYDNNQSPRYRLLNHFTNPEIKTRLAYFVDFDTCIQMPGRKMEEYMGIHIDIYPVDHLPNNSCKRKILLLKRAMLLKINRGCALNPVLHKGRLKRIIVSACKKICMIFNQNKVLNLLHTVVMKYSDESETNQSRSTIFVGYCPPQIFPACVMRSYKDYAFDGEMYRGVTDYDACLSVWYGDYMTPPPMEKRIVKTNAETKYYWKE